MATYYFRNTGDVNWGTATNWSLTDGGGATGAVPTAADDALFTVNSGNCTVNASLRVAKSLNFTGYTNTITMSNIINCSGNLTLGASMGIGGTEPIQLVATSTITSNGKTWTNGLNFNTSQITLGDDFTISGTLGQVGGNTINGSFKLILNGGFSLSSALLKGTGTPQLYLKSGTYTTTDRIFIDTFFDGNITIGNILSFDSCTITYLSGTTTLTANNTFRIFNAGTLNVASINWNNVTFTNADITLSANLNINGLLTNSGSVEKVLNGNFAINCNGGIQLNCPFSNGTGTRVINLLGGTWNTTSSSGALKVDTVINGNITISGNVYYNTGTLTYTTGIVTVTSSTLNLGTCTINTGSLMWNNIQTGSPATTLTLSSDLNINGEWNQNIFGTTINGSFNINCFGGIFAQGGAGQGTGSPVLNIKGGTWRGTGIQTLNTNIDGNVNITLNGGGFSTRTLTYVSGNVTCTSTSNVSLGGTLNVAQIQFANAVVQNGTLLADLNISGQVSSSGISASGAFNVNIGNGLRVTTNQLSGTATFVIRGGTIDLTGAVNGALNANVVLNGNVYILNYGQLGGTLTYLGGTVTGDLLTISSGGAANPTLINMDKVQLRRVNITPNQNLQMNKFFNGTASNPTRIQCATAGATYVVTFQDTLEKIANNVKVSGCNISRPGQLIINGANSNKGTNTGIRYINQSPNALPKNSPPIPTQIAFGIGNISDPTMVVS